MNRNIIRATLGLLVITACAAAWTSSAPQPGEFPDDFYFYGPKRPQKLRDMEGKAAPELTLKNWIGDEQKLADLKGKVVVVDFWATWCPPCRAAIPHNIELFKEHKDDGLMIIGVHDAARGSEKMAAMAKDKGINYPLAVDDGGKSTKAWNVSFWPTYVIIDRKGTVRAAGLSPDNVDQVVEKLLKETAPAKAAPPGKDEPKPKGQVYIDGDVERPGAYQLPLHGRLTLGRALTAAGVANRQPISVLVQSVNDDGTTVTRFTADPYVLPADFKTDYVLAANDRIVVTASSGG